jgi:hypothetical protein
MNAKREGFGREPGKYYEKDEPQPQERDEFGLMKLNPCRISVSS